MIDQVLKFVTDNWPIVLVASVIVLTYAVLSTMRHASARRKLADPNRKLAKSLGRVLNPPPRNRD